MKLALLAIALTATTLSMAANFSTVVNNTTAATMMLIKIHTINDPAISPGVPRVVTKENLCTTSTGLVRNVPESEKKQVYKNYGLTGNHTGYCKNPDTTIKGMNSGCEVDHIISLELGGSNDIKNLWPQPYFGHANAHDKDKLENKLHSLICSDKISIEDAQKAISTNWTVGYEKYIGKLPK